VPPVVVGSRPCVEHHRFVDHPTERTVGLYSVKSENVVDHAASNMLSGTR
jgi:hypothetical protein